MSITLSIKINDLLTIAMILVFVAHLGYIVYEIIHPRFPEIVKYKKDLSEIEYPITFKICDDASNLSFTAEKYQKYGYSDLWQFYSGQSMFNSSVYGWAGHTENGTTFGSVEGFLLLECNMYPTLNTFAFRYLESCVI